MKPEVAIIVYDLRGSGVVRNALRIAGRAVEAGLSVELWVIRQSGAMAGAVPEGVELVELGTGSQAASRELDSFRNVGAIRAAIEERQPAVFMSAGNQMHIFASLAWTQAERSGETRFVGRASNAVIARRGSLSPWRIAAGAVERRQYAPMHRIAAVAEELREALQRELRLEPSRIVTIPNGVDLQGIAAAAEEPLSHPWFAQGQPPVLLGIGRLSRQKDFELLIRAFAEARKRRPLRLMILGEGPSRPRLERLVAKLGLEGDVELPGFVPNPFAYLARACLFVLSSRWEGASNVLIEALACGCPVVATACPTGIEEVLEQGPIVRSRDPTALAEAILARLEQPRNSDLLMACAARYDLSATLDAYADLLRGEVRLARLSNAAGKAKDAP